MENKEILDAINALTESVNQNLRTMQTALSNIEERLEAQERRTKRTYEKQVLQESDIEELKKIVYELAENKPLKRCQNCTAIPKEEAYRRFAQKGYGKVTATRALAGAGVLRSDSSNRRSLVIRLDRWTVARVLIVIVED